MSTLKTPDNAKEGVVAHCAQKRGRQRGFRMSEAHRGKIKNSSILRALIEYFEGKREMSATQVSVGLRLLKKVLPDLQSVTIGEDAANPIHHQHEVDLTVYSDEDLETMIRILRPRQTNVPDLPDKRRD